MRKVRYGLFCDFMPLIYDDDCGLIGAHLYIRRSQEAAYKTVGGEYYIEENGRKVTIDDATMLEKIIARLIYAIDPTKKRVLGVRSNSPVRVNPYSDPNPQLGVVLDNNGQKTVDEGYFEGKAEEAAERGDRKAFLEAERREEEVRRSLEERESPEAEKDNNGPCLCLTRKTIKRD